MSEAICPYSATLAKDDFACAHADQIIRRGGTEFACRDNSTHALCCRIHAHLKTVALPAFDLEDDLLTVPHGVLAKIQFGGLLGLQRILPTGTEPVAGNISALIGAVAAEFQDIDTVPYEQLIDDITGYKLARRRRR